MLFSASLARIIQLDFQHRKKDVKGERQRVNEDDDDD